MLIDFHIHIFPPEVYKEREGYLARDRTFSTLYADPKAKFATAEVALEEMDRAGVRRAVAVNIGWASPQLCQETNDYLLETARKHPDRLIPFCSVNPLFAEKALDEVERCERMGARGIGELHPEFQGYSLDNHEVMGPLMAKIKEKGLVLLSHASEPVGHSYPGKDKTTPGVLYRFVLQHPGTPLVLAHWGGGLPFYALMPEVAQALRHVYVDTAASPFLYRPEISSVVAKVLGVEHILFGSDFPLLRPQRVARQVKDSGLSEEDQAKVLGQNAKRLLRLD